MTRCAHCELPVQGDGVSGAIGDGAAPVRYCCHGCRMVAETIGAEGLEPTSEERQLLYRFFGGALAAAFVMALSLAVSSGYGFGALRRLAPDTANIAHWAILAAALPALILLGVPVLQAALADVRRGRITLEVLFALGTGSAVGASAFSYIRGAGPVYLETATMLLALYTLGRFLDARAKGRAARVLGRLLEVPTSYYDRLHPDPGLVSPEVLRIGDRFRVRIGDALPVDGTVVAGRSFVDEAGLTGEARPVTKGMGDAVWAGTNTLDGALEVRATAVGTERRLARIEAATEAALARPPRVAAVADRVLRWLVPGTVVLALTTFAAWFALAGFDRALYAGLAVVLIACPCALGLAVPLSLVSALGGAARRGILVRSGEALLALADVRAVIFDKTGTLSQATTERVHVRAPALAVAGEGGAEEAEADRLLAMAAAVEAGVGHPLAAAVVREAEQRGLALPLLLDVEAVPGQGIVGHVQDGSIAREVAIGGADLLSHLAISLSEDVRWEAKSVEGAGPAALFLAIDGKAVAVLSVEERPVGGAAEAVAELREAGVYVEVVSGDRPAAAKRFGAAMGVPACGDVSPERKGERVRALRARYGAVAVVGDGINDAAALAEADVGIALAAGASVAVSAADIALYADDLRALPWLLDLGRRTRRTIRQNLAWTFAYNGTGLGLAATGLLHPLVAVVIMAGSSALVTWNALRLRSGSADAEVP